MRKELNKSVLADLKKNYEEHFSKSSQNVVSTVGIMDASVDYELLRKNSNVFSKELRIGKITDQKQSGRCWMFAGLNTLKVSMIKRFNLQDIKFSHNYLYFYDKLERANRYLDDVIELKDRDIDDRLYRGVTLYAADDGAWWETFAILIKKYGIVPEYVFPDSKNVSFTNTLIDNLNKRLKVATKDIRNAYNSGKESEISSIKDKAMADIYKITAISLGIPPKRFDLILRDKDNKLIERRNISPLEFYNEFLAEDIEEYVEVSNYPSFDKEENVLYSREYIQQRLSGDLRFLNVSVARLKELTIKMLDNDEPVWFACDVGKDSLISRDGGDTGFMVYNILNRDLLFDLDTTTTKKERTETLESDPTHAMVIVGYDKTSDGLKFKVQNSWGAKTGLDGFLVMDEAWFDNYVFEIIPKKSYLNSEELVALKKEPVQLMPWNI